MCIQMSKELLQGWGESSKAEHLTSMYQALTSIFSTEIKKIKTLLYEGEEERKGGGDNLNSL